MELYQPGEEARPVILTTKSLPTHRERRDERLFEPTKLGELHSNGLVVRITFEPNIFILG